MNLYQVAKKYENTVEQSNIYKGTAVNYFRKKCFIVDVLQGNTHLVFSVSGSPGRQETAMAGLLQRLLLRANVDKIR